uniref:Syringolide-induced protein 14-1-1 n=1 Tax=Noccaea caerulescens TaxID=107243 RepID=A0A1J3EGZ5_NOCCA
MDNKHHTSTSKPKHKNKILKMLPKAMSFGHHVPPFSPGRDLHHHHNTTNKAFFSGPMVPLVPNAARVRRAKSDAVWDEPTSPKVSCIGQIKLVKSKRCSPKKNKAPPSLIPKISKTSSSLAKDDEKGRGVSKIKRFFSFSAAGGGGNTSRKSHSSGAGAVADEHPVGVVSAAVPSLGQMKKFASSRDALGGFDWTVELKQDEEESPADHCRGYYSDDEKKRGSSYFRDDDDDEEDDIIIPFSAPLSLKPKTEVNLWKRRTMDPPKPLHLKI